MIKSTKIKVRAKQNNTRFKAKHHNYAKKSRKWELINYLRSELRTTTTHALPYVVDAKIHWLERVFWGLNLMLATGIAIYLLAGQYARFIERPIVMSVEMDYFNWNVSYPAITLCPHFKADPDTITALINDTRQRTGKNIEFFLWSIVTSGLETLELAGPHSDEILSMIEPKDYAGTVSLLFLTLNENSVTTNTNSPISIRTAMTEVGMCHVINSNVAVYDDPSQWRDSAPPPPFVKSNIQLSVHDRDFFTQVMNYAIYYKVYIHSSDEIILVTTPSYTHYEKGFISFGVKAWTTKIAEVLRHTTIHLRRCRFITEPISARYPIYSYNRCMLECRIQMIIKLCGCIPHFYKPLDHERICNIVELKCLLKHKKEIISLSTSKETYAKFANPTGLPLSSHDCDCVSACETEVYEKEYENFTPEEDLIRLKVGISSFPKVRVVRDVIFSFYDVILRSGGVVNLCLGTSIISLVELIVIAVKAIFWLIRLKNQGKK